MDIYTEAGNKLVRCGKWLQVSFEVQYVEDRYWELKPGYGILCMGHLLRHTGKGEWERIKVCEKETDYEAWEEACEKELLSDPSKFKKGVYRNITVFSDNIVQYYKKIINFYIVI